jgi:hypothetical protein
MVTGRDDAAATDYVAVVRPVDPDEPRNPNWFPRVYWDPRQVLDALVIRLREVVPSSIDVGIIEDPLALALLHRNQSIVGADGVRALDFPSPERPESTHWIAERIRRCLDVVGQSVSMTLSAPWPTSSAVPDQSPDGEHRVARGWSSWTWQTVMAGWAYPEIEREDGSFGWIADGRHAGPLVLRLPNITIEGERELGPCER